MMTRLVEDAEMRAGVGGLDWGALPKEFKRAVGCAECAQTGYRGRVGIAEGLEMTPNLFDSLKPELSPDEHVQIAVDHGMTTLSAYGVLYAGQGITTLEEVTRIFA